MAFLKNDNLILRALEPEDLDILYEWENNAELWKYGSTLTPYSKFALRDYLTNSLLGIIHTRQLRLMAIDKKTDLAVGTIDLFDYDPVDQKACIGILVDTKYRGKGFGEDMMNMAAEYAFNILHLNQIYAYIPISNTGSYNLLYRCGYIQTGLLKSWHKTPEGFEDVWFMQLVKD
jgi:diamine N-acetyltransferase